jgi:hypothetical protein
VIEFVQKKFLMPTNVDAILIPLQTPNHLSAIIIGGDVLFHYNPLRFASIFQSIVLHHFKVWAISHGKLIGTHEWKRVISKSNWEWLDGPQQESN